MYRNVFRLNPYFENFGKRVIKSPKIYFTEIGLASYLLGIQSPKEVSRDPLLGGLFENMVIVDILKTRFNAGLPDNLYYYRDNHGNEVDLIYEDKRKLLPVEIKSAMTYHKSMLKGLQYFRNTAKNASGGMVIYAGELEFSSEDFLVRKFTNIKDQFK